jgi:hypothetical protein
MTLEAAGTPAQQTPGPWQVRVHPFGGGYCLSRIGANGRREMLLGVDGVSAQTFFTRGEADTAIAKTMETPA